jgi:transposase InsO family protein
LPVRPQTANRAISPSTSQDAGSRNDSHRQTRSRLLKVLVARKIKISMDGKGAWSDNVFVERPWRSIKYEEVYLRAMPASRKPAPGSAGIWAFTTAAARYAQKLVTPDQAAA